MATRLKTIEYWFPHLSGATDNSDTSFTQITLYIPESGITFRSVVVEITAHDAQTSATNVTARNVDIQLGSAGYQSIDNAQTLSNSSEQFCISWCQDFTSYFVTNWAGQSMTMDCRVLINTSAAGCRNLTSRVIITYEYDDTSWVHVKTVYIPLNAPLTAPGNSKPGTAIATIPNLSTFCPESNKTFRQTALCIQGNEEASSNTTDMTLSYEIDSAGAFTSNIFEQGLNTSMSYRLGNVISFTTNATHEFYFWASLFFSHPQIWIVATYEFIPETTTTVLNSLILPMEFGGGMGTSSTTYKTGERELWIQESGITGQSSALFIFYEASGALSSLNAKAKADSGWSGYTSAAATVAGSCALMIRNDDVATSLTRGRNTLNGYIYNVDNADVGAGLSSFWMINYCSDKHTDGVGSHNHTVYWQLITCGTGASTSSNTSIATGVTIPESIYFLTGVGVEVLYDISGSINPGGVYVGTERLSSENGFKWETGYESMNSSDPEIGIRWAFGQMRNLFKRYPTDADSNRLDITQPRRYLCQLSTLAFYNVRLIITYHSITYTVSGTVSGSGGGTVNLYLHKSDTLEVSNKGEIMQISSRSGDGSYSFTVYDNTEDVFVQAYEDSTHMGRSSYEKAT